MIDVAPIEVTAAGEDVEFIAKITVARRGEEVNEEGGKRDGENCAPGEGVCGDRIGICHANCEL